MWVFYNFLLLCYLPPLLSYETAIRAKPIISGCAMRSEQGKGTSNLLTPFIKPDPVHPHLMDILQHIVHFSTAHPSEVCVYTGERRGA